jgi:hypothetical protein
MRGSVQKTWMKLVIQKYISFWGLNLCEEICRQTCAQEGSSNSRMKKAVVAPPLVQQTEKVIPSPFAHNKQ